MWMALCEQRGTNQHKRTSLSVSTPRDIYSFYIRLSMLVRPCVGTFAVGSRSWYVHLFFHSHRLSNFSASTGSHSASLLTLPFCCQVICYCRTYSEFRSVCEFRQMLMLSIALGDLDLTPSTFHCLQGRKRFEPETWSEGRMLL
jgi:hypothetical protein